ncbi:MAG: peptidoglycan DD-metalloendopeptidase family protein [Bacteroidota bacterium]
MTASEIIPALKQYQLSFHHLVSFNPLNEKLLLFDLTKGNKSLTPDILNNTEEFISYVDRHLKGASAKYGIGGYAEHRTVYSSSKVFDADKQGEEPRRLHLGTDIWGKAHTEVMAPLEGIVHSFAFNNQFGDYGATIILAHNLNGVSFYTLFGHLSLNSIKNIKDGATIHKGDVFAEFGIPAENGQWPPHLHFQIIADIGKWKGDYPGVCRFSEKEKWLGNSPDPDIILQLNQHIIK